MSTELKTISAKIEIPKKHSLQSDYLDTEISLNRFWGGNKRGTSLQITFLNEDSKYSHIQLDAKNIRELKDILNTEFK